MSVLQPRRPELRGRCRELAEALVDRRPELRLVRGWYGDPDWGDCEHWWCEEPDGTVVDPTVEQFPSGHIAGLGTYREYDGVHPCPGCGIPVEDEDDPFCCGACYGAMVGLWSGRCTCI